MLWSEPLRSQSLHMLSLFGMVDDCWVLSPNVELGSALHGFSNFSGDLFDALNNTLSCGDVIGADSALHEGFIGEDVEGVSRLKLTDRKDNVLSTAAIAAQDTHQSRINSVGSADWVSELLRCRSMATLSNYFDLDNSHCGEKGAFTNAYVTLVEVWNVVEPVDLINTIHAVFFNHGFSTSWPLFSRLHQEPQASIAWNLVSVGDKYLSTGHQAGHVPIVTTHVCVFSLCLVW